jgi:multiple sugar transport system ATP-binding protein
MTARLDIRGVGKSFGDRPVLRDVSLAVEQGEFVALLGPSGCGKSTLLAILAGFETADRGSVARDGADLLGIPAHRRGIGYVPQDYALFSHMSVRKNLEFGLDAARLPAGERRSRFDVVVDRLDLAALLEQRPATLNMSEMQRVALGRALAPGPSLILLDEPMSNLDADLRARLRGELKQIQRSFGQTVLYVTHDQIEAMAMADRIAVMREGAIEQVDSPAAIYRLPRNRYVANFIGEPPINLLTAELKPEAGGSAALVNGTVVAHLPARFEFGQIELGIRPHDVAVDHLPSAGSFPGRVADLERLGAEHLAIFALDWQMLHAVVPRNFARVGETLHLTFDPAALHLFDAAGDALGLAAGAAERAA